MFRRTLGAAMAVGALFALAPLAQAQTTLRFNNWLPPTQVFNTDILRPWAADAEKATNGRVKIEFTASSLAPPPRQFDLVASRGADLGFSVAGYTTDRLPLASIMAVPFLGNSGEASSVAFWRIYKKHFEKLDEFRGVKLLGAYSLPGGQIFSKNPIMKIADFRGVKMRVGSATLTRMMEAVGAVGVFAPAPRSFELMSNGVTEGGGYSYDTILEFKIEPYLKNVLVVPGGLVNDVFYIMVNPQSWEALSPADRQAIESVSYEAFALRGGKAADRNNDAARTKLLAEHGLKEHQADAAMMAELRQRLQFAEDAWIQQANAKGLNGAAILKELRDEVAAYEARMKRS